MRLLTYLALFGYVFADHRYDHEGDEDEDEEALILDEEE